MDAKLTWTKSSYSLANNCVEVATAPAAVHVRDSKDSTKGELSASRAAWSTFVQASMA